MYEKIAILGLNGVGKSTINHALANKIGYYEMDAEDYYFPNQKSSRLYALENKNYYDDVSFPFSNPLTKLDAQKFILKDMQIHPQFIFSSVALDWCDEIKSLIQIIFLLEAPLELRIERIKMREEKRFGKRVLLGGDMYEQQKNFCQAVSNRNLESVEKSISPIKCPIVKLDATKSVEYNLQITLDACKNLTTKKYYQ